MEEAPLVVIAATGALGPVVAKLSTLLRRRCGDDREYQLRRQTRKDVKIIKSKLKSIHSILWVIWEREVLDVEGKELRMEAWRLADDMNDAIDDFMLTLKRSSDGKRFTQVKIQPSPFQDLKRRAVDVSERCRSKWKTETAHSTFSSLFSRTKSTVDDSGPAKWPTRVNDPYVRKDISELEGMEERMEKLIDHLVGEHESTPQLKMASILGAGGVGKTTIARLVFEAIQDKFQARAFVSVTSCHNMTEVLESILQQVNPDSTVAGTKTSTKNKDLIDAISSFLKDKRYLVIIDDIWRYGEWETVVESLPDNNLGSRIVTTTRVNSITDKWREDFDDALVYRIDYLERNWEPSFSNKMIGTNAHMVGEGGFDHFHPVVKMCRGIPLAVACMFSALAKERERQEQQGMCTIRTRDLQDRIEEQVKRNGIQNTPGFEALVESLELGYNHLPHHMLKTCLLYCSIYPQGQGYSFSRDDLVRQWMAQGFVCKEEIAKDYFKELVSRGFINKEKYLKGYQLHPMMHNYLRCKLREHDFITCSSDIPSSPVGGLLCIDDLWVDALSGIDDWHHIRSLVVLENAERVPYKDLQHLRVLDVQSSDDLENKHLKDMCGLLRLRHLFLLPRKRTYDPRSGITEMPAEIGRLQYLETLVVVATGIRRLPAEIGDLKQLKTLDMISNREIAELPREMGNLHHILERLIICGSSIREQAWEIIRTLKNLKTLDVSGSRKLSGIPRGVGELLHLETLNLSRTSITELPREIGNLQRLQILGLAGVRTITKLPREIGKLQHLETLDLRSTNVRKIPREIGGLKKLKNLDAEIGTLPFEAAQLPKLDGVPKCVQTAWDNSDLISSLAGEILSFQKTNSWTVGDGGLVVGTKHMHIPQWIEEHFNNICSLDIRICTLEERDLKILREMPYLGMLALRFEAVPREPIAISSGGFAKLWHLTVDSRVPQVTFQEGAMPRLYNLIFQFQFYGGVPNTDPVGINHLVHLSWVNFCCSKWYRGNSPCISATIDTVRKEALKHPNRYLQVSVSVEGQEWVVFRWPLFGWLVQPAPGSRSEVFFSQNN